MAKAEKEVAKKKGTNSSAREHSFGSTPPDIGVGKGATMQTFGYKPRGNNVWPPAATSVDQKSKFPESRKM